MKTAAPLIFPPCAAGTGDILPGRVNKAGKLRWERLAVELDTRGHDGGRPTVGALMRAIGAGAVVLVRKDSGTGPVSISIGPGPVHRGCPTD